MMRAFVTGGTGFVGANLVEGLNRQGIPVRLLHRPTSSLRALEGLAYEPVTGDVLAEPEQLARLVEGCDWLFHTAAVADYWRQRRPDWLYRVNVEGTRRVLAAARLAGVKRVVFTSSLAAMGLPRRGQVLDESSQFNVRPRSWPYGHSKHLAEQEVRRAVDGGLEAVIVNPTVILGPRDVHQISGAIITEAARGLARLVLPGGTNYVAVADVVAGHIAAAEKGRPGERYILGAHNLRHAEVLRVVCQVVGRPAPRRTVPAWLLPPAAYAVRLARFFLGNRIPFDASQVRMAGMEIYADAGKAVAHLGLPQTPFATFVQQAYDWYRANHYL